MTSRLKLQDPARVTTATPPMMMKFSMLALACGASSLLMQKQDPCAGCDTALEERYQKCAREYGNHSCSFDPGGGSRAGRLVLGCIDADFFKY